MSTILFPSLFHLSFSISYFQFFFHFQFPILDLQSLISNLQSPIFHLLPPIFYFPYPILHFLSPISHFPSPTSYTPPIHILIGYHSPLTSPQLCVDNTQLLIKFLSFLIVNQSLLGQEVVRWLVTGAIGILTGLVRVANP